MMMKKIQKYSIFSRFSRLLAVVAVAFVFLLTSCDLFSYKRPFDDAYYDNNFIAGIGFDQFVGANGLPSDVSKPTTGQWDFAYRYLDWDAYSYMTLHVTDTIAPIADPGLTVASFDTVPSGLSSTAPVYRLNVVNLIRYGDFETTTDGYSGYGGTWAATGTPSPARITTLQLFGDASINLSALLNQTVTFPPTYIIAASDFLPANTYKAFFEYLSSNPFNVKVGDAGISGTTGSALISFTGSSSLPSFVFSPPESSSFSGLKVDNFRLTINAEKKLRLLLTPTQTIPTLEWGVYSFSIWVHTDPIAYSYKEPYQLDTFTVTMAPGSAGSLSQTSATYVWASGAGWQKLTATLAPGALMFNDTTDPVIELVLDFNNTKPGSVLLAQPELRFNPDGL